MVTDTQRRLGEALEKPPEPEPEPPPGTVKRKANGNFYIANDQYAYGLVYDVDEVRAAKYGRRNMFVEPEASQPDFDEPEVPVDVPAEEPEEAPETEPEVPPESEPEPAEEEDGDEDEDEPEESSARARARR
jgi:hypothetical protein